MRHPACSTALRGTNRGPYPEQLQEIAAIIRRHHAAYVVNWFSPQAVPADVLDELKQRGLVDLQAETIRDSYLLGQVVAQLGSAESHKLTYRN